MTEQIRFLIEFDAHEWYENDLKTALDAAKILKEGKYDVKLSEIKETMDKDYHFERETVRFIPLQ